MLRCSEGVSFKCNRLKWWHGEKFIRKREMPISLLARVLYEIMQHHGLQLQKSKVG